MNSVVVVDASIVVKWVVNVPESSKAKSLLMDWTKKDVVVIAPTLLAYEANNALYKYVKAGQISYEDVTEGLMHIIFPAVSFDFSEETVLTVLALGLAHRFGLSATYDAHYLALAEHKSCEFWTSDTRVWKKVKEHLSWVKSLDDYHPDASM